MWVSLRTAQWPWGNLLFLHIQVVVTTCWIASILGCACSWGLPVARYAIGGGTDHGLMLSRHVLGGQVLELQKPIDCDYVTFECLLCTTSSYQT